MFDGVEMLEVGRKWAGADVRACADDDLFEAAVALEGVISLAQAASAHVLAELEARDACDAVHGMATSRWVAREAGVAPGPVRQRLRVGRVLRTKMSVIDEAVSVGEVPNSGGLSFDHAKALADVVNPRVVDALGELQSEIVELAAGCSFEAWKAQVRALVDLLDADGTEPDDLYANRLSLTPTLDGLCHLEGTLTPDVGLAVRSAIDAKADELFRRFSSDAEVAPEVKIPSRATLRALAVAELLRIAVGRDHPDGSAPRAEVTLVLHNGEATDAEGRPVPRAAAGVWGCDPEVWAVVVDEMGIPLDVGHARRLATAAQRRAVAVRDGGCVFPGCDAPIEWTDLHHVRHWLDGGRTDLANLVALCRHHHGVAHRNGWSMHITDDQHVWWRSPSGRRFWGQRHRRRRAGPPPDECPGCPGCRGDAVDEKSQVRRATMGP